MAQQVHLWDELFQQLLAETHSAEEIATYCLPYAAAYQANFYTKERKQSILSRFIFPLNKSNESTSKTQSQPMCLHELLSNPALNASRECVRLIVEILQPHDSHKVFKLPFNPQNATNQNIILCNQCIIGLLLESQCLEITFLRKEKTITNLGWQQVMLIHWIFESIINRCKIKMIFKLSNMSIFRMLVKIWIYLLDRSCSHWCYKRLSLGENEKTTNKTVQKQEQKQRQLQLVLQEFSPINPKILRPPGTVDNDIEYTEEYLLKYTILLLKTLTKWSKHEQTVNLIESKQLFKLISNWFEQ